MRTLREALDRLVLLAVLSLPGPARAQTQAPPAWNDDAVLDLVRRAQTTRRTQSVDSTFQSYEAMADGYVYFYLDPMSGHS